VPPSDRVSCNYAAESSATGEGWISMHLRVLLVHQRSLHLHWPAVSIGYIRLSAAQSDSLGI